MITEQMKSEAMALTIITDADEAYYVPDSGYADVWYGDLLISVPVVKRLVDEAEHIGEMLKRHAVEFNNKRRSK